MNARKRVVLLTRPGSARERTENIRRVAEVSKLMVDAGITEDKIKDIDKEIRQIVAESADFAESAPEPELHELYTDVLVEQY